MACSAVGGEITASRGPTGQPLVKARAIARGGTMSYRGKAGGAFSTEGESTVTKLRLVLALIIVAAAVCRGGSAKDTAAVEARLAEYAQLVQRMDHHAIAQLYSPHGELQAGPRPIVGPGAIEAYLRTFEGTKVLEYTADADTTIVHGDRGHQTGPFRQRVQLPNGQTIEVRGRFQVDWERAGDGRWLIRRMGTTSGP